MCIFDRSFGSIDNRWPVDELINHLNTIDILFVEFETSQIDALFPTTTASTILSLNDPYARVVTLIVQIKQQFAQQYSVCIKWSDGNTKWSSKNKENEVRNMDELIYDFQGRHCTIPIICSAKIELDQTTLLVGSGTLDGTVQLKHLCKLDNKTNDADVCKYFDNVVKRLVKEKLEQVSGST
jgi:hypothetical protein